MAGSSQKSGGSLKFDGGLNIKVWGSEHSNLYGVFMIVYFYSIPEGSVPLLTKQCQEETTLSSGSPS